MPISKKAPTYEKAPTSEKVVVVHRSARDAYQVSVALRQAGLLEALVTDLYWPADRKLARKIGAALPLSARQMLLARNHSELPSRLVNQSLFSGLTSLLAEKLSRLPFWCRQAITRWSDASLGRRAGGLATEKGSLLLSYSYYGFHAFSRSKRPGMLFQLHPHPVSVRDILRQELIDHPDCAPSLQQEWELSLPAEDFDRLAAETQMASHWLVASSFTRKTLVENGIPAEAIDVIPYGVDLERFTPAASAARPADRPLRLLFVGRINQRKGIKYLLEALRLLRHRSLELTICGRVVDDLALLKPFGSQIKLRPSVSNDELVAAYREADLFVLPSVAEGFGQVLLEALACGLPILSTTNTAAPDLIDEGIQGFVVPPRRPDLLANRIEWALDHRAELASMRSAARQRAEQFTWARFRREIVESTERFSSRQMNLAAGANRPKAVPEYV